MSDVVEDFRKKRYKQYLKSELEAAAIYRAMAKVEKDSSRVEVFERLMQAEMRHAFRWADKLGIDRSHLEPAQIGWRLRIIQLTARTIGTIRLIPWLLRGEAKDLSTYAADPEARDFAREERRHARVLREMASGRGALEVIRDEATHSVSDGGKLRAAVLGVNDGLVSNFCLVMGVAGGTGDPEFVLLAGIAGLMAGAFSMAAGEYISMRSQRDVYEYRIRMEQAELEEWPEEEEEELVLIYQAKGLSQEDSERIAKKIMSQPQVALETMAREELGLDPSQLGSPWGAAISSFIAFVMGAIVPILTYIFDAGDLAFMLSGVLSGGMLFVVGGIMAMMTNRNVGWGALRMLVLGGAAAAVTFGLGHFIGVSVIG